MDEGYLVLAGRVRVEEEVEAIKTVGLFLLPVVNALVFNIVFICLLK